MSLAVLTGIGLPAIKKGFGELCRKDKSLRPIYNHTVLRKVKKQAHRGENTQPNLGQRTLVRYIRIESFLHRGFIGIIPH